MKALLLIGGLSSRMKSPKALLPFPTSSTTTLPLYVHLYRILRESGFEEEDVYISLRPSQSSLLAPTLPSGFPTSNLLFDDNDESAIGPASGLLVAHTAALEANWLILAVDFPLITVEAIEWLMSQHQPQKNPTTAYLNSEGFDEPLFAIWESEALRCLKDNVAKGKRGPSFSLLSNGRTKVLPKDERWLTNVNTLQDWEEVHQRLLSIFKQDDESSCT